eukprot:UN07578
MCHNQVGFCARCSANHIELVINEWAVNRQNVVVGGVETHFDPATAFGSDLSFDKQTIEIPLIVYPKHHNWTNHAGYYSNCEFTI